MGRSAEQEYRDAWQRIKEGKPIRIPVGSPATLANIAREAGKDPSALKRSRFPSLVHEIEIDNQLIAELPAYVDRSLSSQLKGARNENRRILLDMDVLRAERDALKSQVLNLQLALLERSQQLDVYIGPISVSSLDHHKWKTVNERGGDAKS